MHRLADARHQTGLTQFGEINDNTGFGGDTRHDLDVQRHFGVGLGIDPGIVAALADVDVVNPRQRNLHRRAGFGDIIRPVTTGGFNDGYTLAGPTAGGRETVEAGNLRREKSVAGVGDGIFV